MTAQQMMMIYVGLLVVILFLGFIWGIIHGRRKSTYKLVTTIIFYTVFFLIIEKVAIIIVDYPFLPYLVNAGVQLPAEMAGATTIKEACAAYLASLGMSSDEIIPILMSFATVVAKIAFTLIYFIPIALVYWLLVNIIYFLFVRRKKARIRKMQKKMEAKPETLAPTKKKKIKLKQHRLTGGFLGLVKKVPQVIVIIAVTSGIVSLIPTIKGEDTSTGKVELNANIESNELIDLLNQNGLQEYVKFVEMYRNSPFVKVLGGDVDNKRLSGLIFDKLTQGKYEDYTLDLQGEMAFIISTGAKAYGITKGNTDINTLNVTQQKEMCALLKDLTDSKLIMSLLPVGASVALSLDQVKQAIDQNLPGLEISPDLLKDVNWENDIVNISDTAMALVDLTGGFQNLNNINYLTLNPEYVKTLTKCISDVSLLMKIIPVIAEYAVTMPEVQEMVGDISAQIKQVVWSDEIVNVGNIYEKFAKIGLTSFDNIMGELTAPVDPNHPEDDKLTYSQELVTTLFQSNFISLVFPVVFNKVIEGQEPQIKQLFEGLQISEWDYELNTIIDLARDVRDNGGSLTNLDLSIVRDVNVDTILRSELLTQGFTKIFTTYDQTGSIGEQIGLADYIYVPEDLKNVTSATDNKWFKKAEKVVDEDGNVTYNVEHRELADILTAFQKILPKEGEIDFNKFPEYILQIPDYYLTDEKDPNRDKTGYSSIFDSLVLRTSISNMVMSNEQIKDMVVIPETAAPDYIDNKVHVIKIDELNSMVKGIKALGISDFTNIKPSYEMIENLKHDYDSKIPGDSKKITNLDMILSSDIVYSTFSNILIDMEEKSNGILAVPTDVLDPVETFNTGEFNNIKLEEIHKVVDAILVFDNLDFENPQFSIDMITNLTDEKISTVSESSILRNTITNVLKDYDTNDTVVIPVSALNENHYITKQELHNMIKGVKVLPPEILEAPDQLDMNALIKDLNNPSIEGDPTSPKNVEIILKSDIVHSTISKYLIDATVQSNGMIIIPTDVKLPEEDRLANTTTKSVQIDALELKKIVNAVNILPIDLASPNVSIETLLDIYYEEVKNADGTTTKKYNEAKGDADITGIIDSAIINTTLTNVLLDQATPKEGQEAMIVIPDNGTTILTKNDFNYINKVELQNVIKGFIALGIKDCIKPDGSFDFSPNIIKTLEDKFEDTGKAKIDIVLNSNIVHTTLSHQINKAAKDFEGQIAIPLISDAKNKHYTIDKVKVIGQTELFNNITVEELKKVIHAFNLLDMDFSEGASGFDVNVIFDMNDSEIQDLVASNIINLTISNTLIDQAKNPTSPLVLPVKTFDLVDDYKFIKPVQVSKLITGFNVLLKQNSEDKIDFNNIKITTDMIKSLDDLYLDTGKKKIEVILESYIVDATLSTQIITQLGKEGSVVVICDDVKVVDPKEKDVKDEQITYIEKEELTKLIGAFNVLPIDLENPNVSIDTLLDMYYDITIDGAVTSKTFNELKGDDNIAKLINSAIINCTIANVLIDQATPTPGQDAMIIIPNDGSSIIEKNSFNYINKVELQNVIKGFIALGLNDPKNKNSDGSLNISPNIIKTLETPFENTTLNKIDVVLKSGIVHATLSNQINKAASDFNGQIAIPEIDDKTNAYHTIDKIKVFGQTELFKNITTEELKSVIHAFNLLDMNFEAGTNSFDINVIFDMTDKEIEELVESHIINLTISNNLIDKASESSSPLVLPMKTFDSVQTYKFILADQVSKLINGLNILLKENPTDKISFDSININTNMIKKLNDEYIDVENKPTGRKKIDVILDSFIVDATLSNQLIDKFGTKDSKVVMYDDVKIIDSNNIDVTNKQINYVKKEELINLISAFNVLPIDLDNPTFDASSLLDLTNEQIQTLGSSKILNGTITKSLIEIADKENSFMVIPSDALFDNNHYITYKIKTLPTDEEPELINMIHGIKSLGIEDLNNVTMNNNMINGLNEPSDIIPGKTKIQVALNSKIVHSTLSKVIVDMKNNTPGLIVLPSEVKINANNHNNMPIVNITPEELTKMFKGFSYLGLNVSGQSNIGINDLFALLEKVDPSNEKSETKLDVILKSDILLATISKIIAPIDNLVLTESVRGHLKDVDSIKAEEIKALFVILNELGTTDVNSFAVTEDMIVKTILGSATLKPLVMKSTIMRATLTPVATSIKKEIFGTIISLVNPATDLEKQTKYGTTEEIDILNTNFFTKELSW